MQQIYIVSNHMWSSWTAGILHDQGVEKVQTLFFFFFFPMWFTENLDQNPPLSHTKQSLLMSFCFLITPADIKWGRTYGKTINPVNVNNPRHLHTPELPPLPPPRSRLLPEQVSAHTDDSVCGSVQTNVALEGGPVPFSFPAVAVAAAAVAIVAVLPGRISSSVRRPAVTRRPGTCGRHYICRITH